MTTSEPAHVERNDRPMPGDAVRLASPWKWGRLATGEIGVIGGAVDQYPDNGHAIVTFNASTFRDDRVVSCSGGPATIATDLATLTPTKEHVKLRVWKWKDGWLGAGAGNGESYYVSVPVWEWNPGGEIASTAAKPDDPRLVTANRVRITQGLRVWDYDRNKGYVDLDGSRIDSPYWDGWFEVVRDKGGRSLMNGERVATVDARTGERA